MLAQRRVERGRVRLTALAHALALRALALGCRLRWLLVRYAQQQAARPLIKLQ
jgi:hypothetical protein